MNSRIHYAKALIIKNLYTKLECVALRVKDLRALELPFLGLPPIARLLPCKVNSLTNRSLSLWTTRTSEPRPRYLIVTHPTWRLALQPNNNLLTATKTFLVLNLQEFWVTSSARHVYRSLIVDTSPKIIAHRSESLKVVNTLPWTSIPTSHTNGLPRNRLERSPSPTMISMSISSKKCWVGTTQPWTVLRRETVPTILRLSLRPCGPTTTALTSRKTT